MTFDPNYTTLTAEVRTRLVQEFSLEELRDLCFDVGIDYELFPQQQQTMARELVGYLHRRRRIPQLVERMQAIRPNDDYGFVARAGIEFSKQAQPIPFKSEMEPKNAGLEVVWSHQIDARPHHKPWLMGGVYVVPVVNDTSGKYVTSLYALDASIGELRWRHQFTQSAFSGYASLPDGVIVTLSSTDVLTGEAQVLALAVDGQRRWQISVDGQQVSEPTIFGGRVIIAVDARTCMVLDVNSGSELNRFSLPEDVADAAPVVTEDRLYFPCRGPRILAMSWDGDEDWLYDAGSIARSSSLGYSPLLFKQRLIALSSSGIVNALHPESGVTDWEYDPGMRLRGVTNIFHDGQMLFGGGDAVIYALDAQNGDEAWAIDTQDIVASTLNLHGDMLVCGDSQGRLTAYHTQNGQVLWQHICDSHIEAVLAVVPDNLQGPLVIGVDVLGKVTAFHYPVSATEHEHALRWNMAAQIWEAQGECVHAAKSWERHAKYLDGHGALDTLQAKAWESAAKMWVAVGEAAQAERCQRNRAKFLKLPFIAAKLEHKGVVAGAYSQLHIILENSGYGTALDVQLELQGDAFEIGASSELSLAHLAAGQKRIRALDVRPTAHGDAVPLNVTMRYKDATGRNHRVCDTIYVSITPENLPLSPENLALFARTTLSDMQDSRSEVVMDVFLRSGRRGYNLEIVLDDGQTFTGVIPLAIADNLPITGIKAQGQYLFDQMFGQGDGRDAWSNALGQSLANDMPRRLRLRIDEALPELAALPWETMCAGDLMLSASDKILFSRNLPVKWVDRTLDISQPLKVLIVVASPEDINTKYQLPPLEIGEEKAILTQALKQQTKREVQLHVVKSPVTLDRLRRAVRLGYDMMHIIGHGYTNPRSGTNGMILETSNGRSRVVSWPQFAQLFAQISNVPMLMYFSVCQRSSSHYEARPQSLPSTMIQAGVPAVIAMQDRIAIPANRVMTQQFYTDLLAHGTVDLALQSARAAVLSRELKGAETPVLYSQILSGRLW